MLNQLVVPWKVLTVASWPTCRFLRRQVRWSGIPFFLRIFQFVMIHTVKGFSIVSETEIDVFLKFPCFLYNPANVGNLISSSSCLSDIWVVSSIYLRLLMFLSPILISTCNSSSLVFLMMCSVYRLNKQGDSRHLCHTPFSILNQSVVPYRVLTVFSWPTCRFLRRQVRWSDSPISLRAFHSLLWSTQPKALV